MTVVVLAARRSAVVPRQGAFAALELHELAAPVISAVLQDAGLPAAAVSELICANALGAGGNPARVVALASGLPEQVAGLSIDRQCVGGLDALGLGAALIDSGMADIVIAGGVESYSRRPLRQRTYADERPDEYYDRPPFTPWPDRDPDMDEAADQLAGQLCISREEQDKWAVDSHAKARMQVSEEIVFIEGITRDTFTRKLTPALAARAPELTGTVTAANSAVAADAAAFVVLGRHEAFPEAPVRLGIHATLGADPMLPGFAPVPAIQSVLSGSRLKSDDLTVAEIMEAYAAQAIACVRVCDLPPEIVNKGGGALARGHPIGASGAILAVRLFHELKEKGGTGLAAIAAAGGLGTALLMHA